MKNTLEIQLSMLPVYIANGAQQACLEYFDIKLGIYVLQLSSSLQFQRIATLMRSKLQLLLAYLYS
jgi:hypothetical protein